MKTPQLGQLRIDPALKIRPRRTVVAILTIVGLVIAASLTLVWLRRDGERRVMGPSQAASTPVAKETSAPTVIKPVPGPDTPASRALFVVSGYIINRERIELSPRFQGVVSWIGVVKGDAVKKGQLVVRLEDSEQKVNLHRAQAALRTAQVAEEQARVRVQRLIVLFQAGAVSEEIYQDAELALKAAQAARAEAEAGVKQAEVYLAWTEIRSPIEGLVLEKLAQTGELVVPMSFGGPRGPSTALLAIADPEDLQVEVDVGEADLGRLRQAGACRVIPEAFPDVSYEGRVVEISPEANRQKGTLQVKVKILKPDSRLVPELSARVEFLP